MTIKNWVLTGDTHGWVETRLGNISRNMPQFKPEETGIIILGDAGLNFWLNKSDIKHKKATAEYGYMIYCVHGNHEERPENIANYYLIYDENVGNLVWVEDDFPNIRFLVSGNEYKFNEHPTLVIGGAYSVDKHYRLARAAAAGESFSGWFQSEQLTAREKLQIQEKIENKFYDFVFTHTTALSWEPNDLFIGGVDQSTVDKSMEIWLDELKDTFTWDVWCFGHYHADRVERPHVEQFYQDYEDLEVVWERWKRFNSTGELDWWIPKSPMFYAEEK